MCEIPNEKQRQYTEEIYSIMYDVNNMNREQFEKIKTLIITAYEDGYLQGSKDTERVYSILYEDDFGF
ncbi:MAG: hypothetical protein PUK09_00485 [Bacilli bacterium]|nr:hypothetical protein [Bacilli bacterium]